MATRDVSLRAKILVSLFLVFSLSISSVLFGMWIYQRERLLAMTKDKATQAGLTIRASLGVAMLQNQRPLIQRSLDEVARVADFEAISILNPSGQVVLSSRRSLVGQVFAKDRDPACTVCHQDMDMPPRAGQFAAELRSHRGRYVRAVIKIDNEPDCRLCHGTGQPVLGLLMVDSSLEDIYAVLRTVSQRILLTALLTFAAIVVLISRIVDRFVLRPVRAFLEGIKQLEKGRFDGWVDIRGEGEFAEMAVSFNVMTRAIGRYVTEVRNNRDEIRTLYTIVQRMSETIEWQRVKGIVINLLREIFDAETTVFIHAADSTPGAFDVTWKKAGDKQFQAQYFLDAGEAPHGAVSRRDLERWWKGELTVPELDAEERRALVPLSLRSLRLGLVAVVLPAKRRFGRAERHLLPALTNHISVSLANARLYDLAITDDLTGLYTKRYFHTKAKDLADSFQAGGIGFCLLMLDVDYFKEINDTHGHPVGDRVLVGLAELIRANIRTADIPCRYGGEEFVILLPGSDIQAARQIGDRLRTSVASHTFQIPGAPPIQRTISLGLACCPLHADTAEELLMVADSALYAAKRDGRNQMRIAPSRRPEG
ncbi:MAG: diguanylate cyclase [Thermodesulfobacteriota bacterium]